MTPTVFVSYSHKNAEILKRLQVNLRPLVREGSLELWDDTRIDAGDVWQYEIDKALTSVAAAVLLVSQDFLASDFIHDHEMPPIIAAWKERGIRVYWVLLEPCYYKRVKFLTQLKAVNPALLPLTGMSPHEQAALWAKLAEDIDNDLKAAAAPLWPDRLSEVPSAWPEPSSSTAPLKAMLGRPVPLGSPLYIERIADLRIRAHLQAPGATVTVQGHWRSGKSSLLIRLRDWARKYGRAACFIDFKELHDSDCENVEALFLEIARRIAGGLGVDADPKSDWAPRSPSQTNLSLFLENKILAKVQSPVLLLFEESDLMIKREAVGTELFTTLRNWHNQRANDWLDKGWNQLGLVIFHATNPDTWIKNLRQSTFNVGLREELDDFNEAHVSTLNEQYGSPLSGPAEIKLLMKMVEGLPDLVNHALHAVSAGAYTLTKLLEHAADRDGPFQHHLGALENVLQGDPPLYKEFQYVLKGRGCQDERLFDGLLALGLIRGLTMEKVQPRCKLYKDYFGKKLPRSSR